MKTLQIPEHARRLGNDMEIAVEAAFRGAQIVKENYQKFQTYEQKGVGDFVSGVDRQADAVIQSYIRWKRPTDAMMTEELSPDGEEEDGRRRWIVDPLDATSAYRLQAGNNIPSVMIALREELETQLGVIVFPISGKWFYAKKGEGCFRNGKRIKIPTDVPTELAGAWIDMNHYGDYSLQTPEFSRLDQNLRSPKAGAQVTRSMPHSGIVTTLIEQKKKLSAVIHDNNPKKPKQEAWDKAPAKIILEEAGGVMIGIDGEPINPFKTELIIAAVNRQIATEIAKLARD